MRDPGLILFDILITPIVLIGAWMLGAYGTVSPCGALDVVIAEQYEQDFTPSTVAGLDGFDRLPNIRKRYANTPGKCFKLLWQIEIGGL